MSFSLDAFKKIMSDVDHLTYQVFLFFFTGIMSLGGGAFEFEGFS